MEINLDRLEVGMQGVITQIRSPELLRCRLRSFGLVPGTEVSVRYRSPGGSVTALEFRGSVLALRTGELKRIRVRLL